MSNRYKAEERRVSFTGKYPIDFVVISGWYRDKIKISGVRWCVVDTEKSRVVATCSGKPMATRIANAMNADKLDAIVSNSLPGASA